MAGKEEGKSRGVAGNDISPKTPRPKPGRFMESSGGFYDLVSSNPESLENIERALNVYPGSAGRLAAIVSGPQAEYMADRLPRAIQDVWANVGEDGPSMQERDALHSFNYAIPQLLGKISPEAADDLFTEFEIMDPGQKSDTAQTYSPLRMLYENPIVDEAFKRDAAREMHREIEREERDRREHPEKGGNNAFAAYGTILAASGKKLPQGFLSEEIAHMVHIAGDRQVVHEGSTREVLALLKDQDIRHDFLAQQILHSKGVNGFRLYNEQDVEMARMHMEIMGGAEVVAALHNSLARWEKANGRPLSGAAEIYRDPALKAKDR